jgi:hypothetical protein
VRQSIDHGATRDGVGGGHRHSLRRDPSRSSNGRLLSIAPIACWPMVGGAHSERRPIRRRVDGRLLRRPRAAASSLAIRSRWFWRVGGWESVCGCGLGARSPGTNPGRPLRLRQAASVVAGSGFCPAHPPAWTSEGRQMTVTNYPHVFAPISLGPVEVKNRFYLSPRGVPYAAGAGPSDAYAHYFAERAAGGCGLTIQSLATLPRGDPAVKDPRRPSRPRALLRGPAASTESSCRSLTRAWRNNPA